MPKAFRSFTLFALVCAAIGWFNQSYFTPHLTATTLAQGTAAPEPIWRLTEGPKDAAVSGLVVLDGRIYAATQTGIWVSSDAGATWQARNAGLPTGYTSSLAQQGGVLFVAAEAGVYRSRDGGRSWQSADVGLPTAFSANLFTQGERLYALIYGSGLFFTTDQGESWTPLGSLPSPAASANAAIRGNQLWLGTNTGIYRSNDGGQTWTRAHQGLPANAFANTFAYAGERLLVGLGNFNLRPNETPPGVFTWNEVEGVWQALNQGLEPTAIVNLYTHGADVFAATFTGAYRFDAEKLAWVSVSQGLYGSVDGFSSNGAALYALSGGDLFLSTNRGDNWQALNAQIAPVNAISAFAFNNAGLFAATTSGIYRRANVGPAVWTRASQGLTDRYLTDLTTQGQNLWATAESSKVFFSNDNGQSWASRSNGLDKVSLAHVTTNERAVLVGSLTGGVFSLVRRDGSDIWQAANQGLTSRRINDLFTVGNTFFAATGDGVFRSADDGATWTAVNQGLTLRVNEEVHEARNLSADGTTLYVTLSQRPPGDLRTLFINPTKDVLPSAVFRSNDNGATWTRLEFRPGAPADFLQVLPTTQGMLALGPGLPNILFPYHLSNNVWYSNDKAVSWTLADAGLLITDNFGQPPSFQGGLLGATPTQALLATPYGRGIYVRDLVTMACRYQLTTDNTDLPPSASTLTVRLNTTSQCQWTAASQSAWITIAGATSGTGAGEIRLNIAANAEVTTRSGSIVIGGTTINLTQNACTLAVSPVQPRFEGSGRAGNLAIVAASTCQWELKTDASWITLPTTRRGAGDATVAFTVAANPNSLPRTATLLVGNVTVTVTQAAAQGDCAVQPLALNQWKRETFSPTDCTADFYTFTSQPLQRWYVVYHSPGGAPDITVSDAAGNHVYIEPVGRAAVFRGGADLAMLTFTTTSAGTHTLAVAAARSNSERPYWVKLSTRECITRIRGNDRELRAAGDNETLAVTAANDCAWQAVSTAPWLRLTSSANGTGNGTLTYSAEENFGAARAAAILIGDLNFPVKQAAAVNAGRALTGLDPSYVELGASGVLLNVTGNGFTNNSQVIFGDQPLTTTFVSATQLRAAVPAAALTAAREVAITVETSTPNVWRTPALPFVIRPAQQLWTPTSGPNGGSISAIYQQGTRLWAGTTTGRIFRSDDGGRNWRRQAKLKTEGPLFTLLGITKFVGFGDQLFALTPYAVYRLKLSQPNAQWTPILLPENNTDTFRQLGGLVAKNESVLAIINYKLYQARADSERWTLVGELPGTPAPSSIRAYQLATAGAAATDPLYLFEEVYDLISTERRLFVSNDAGRTWRTIILRFPQDALSGLFGLGSQYLYVLNRRVYFGVANGVFRLDEREQPVRVGNAATNTYDGPRHVSLLAQEGETLYANSSPFSLGLLNPEEPPAPTLFRLGSDERWTRADVGLELSYLNGLLATENGLWAATADGLWFSANRGATWSPRQQGLNAVHISLTTTIGNAVFAASNSAIYRTADNGQTWARADHGLPPQPGVGIFTGVIGTVLPPYGITALAANGDALFAALPQGIFSSTDQGQSWRNTGLVGYRTSALGFLGQQALAAAGKTGNGFSTPTSFPDAGIYRLADSTSAWRIAESSLFGDFPTSLATLNGKVFAGSLNSGIRISDDNGQTWRSSNTGLNTNLINALATVGNTVLAATNEGVYRSSDQGQMWRLTSAPFASYRQVVTQGNTAYALNQTDVYRTDNLGETWRQLPPAQDYELTTVQPLGTRLFAGTAGDGVLLADLAPTTATAVNAASYAGDALAPGSMATLFGSNFSTATEVATSSDLPDELAGTRVLLRSANGTESSAPLFFVSPGQINFLLPAHEPAAAPAQIFVSTRNGTQAVANLTLTPLALGLFTANGNGQGVPAAVALRVRADGSTSYEAVARFDSTTNRFVPVPLDVSPANGTVYLVLYGTGISRRSNTDNVSANIGTTLLQVVYAGPQGNFVGLDQLNIALPGTLVGRGEVELQVTVNGKVSNAVRVALR